MTPPAMEGKYVLMNFRMMPVLRESSSTSKPWRRKKKEVIEGIAEVGHVLICFSKCVIVRFYINELSLPAYYFFYQIVQYRP